MRTLTFVFFLSLLLCSPAEGLMQYEGDGFFLYYPEAEGAVAERLQKAYPQIRAFLNSRGLKVPQPLHVILDASRDTPDVRVHLIPHLEIRIPLRPPGVLEEGYLEADPWRYFLFKGLCLHGIYNLRAGSIEYLHTAFGKIISPNAILPPWVEEGISGLLYAHFSGKPLQDPIEKAVLRASPPPDLEIISNHPEIWPGPYAGRIYGKPFLAWLETGYGWQAILTFLKLHGGSLIPIEITTKAREAFGKSGAALWQDFQQQFQHPIEDRPGKLMVGHWAEPPVYWNRFGVFPGKQRLAHRGRYGFVDSGGTTWVSEYEPETGKVSLYRYEFGVSLAQDPSHIWDPGPGRVAVTRRGRTPQLVVFDEDGQGGFRRNQQKPRRIEMPAGVIQCSGPVRDPNGRIAVAANRDGNWDIWVFDGKWFRITDSPSIEMDPWWQGDALVFSSNRSGTFQIYDSHWTALTEEPHGAALPRQKQFLALNASGWQRALYAADRASSEEISSRPSETPPTIAEMPNIPGSVDYNPLKSLWPNYIRPDVFAAVSDFQIGLATSSRDVSGNHQLNAALRYTFDDDFFALRLGYQYRSIGTRVLRYPLSYTTEINQEVDEARNEIHLFWQPNQIDGLVVTMIGRTFEPLEGEGPREDELVGDITYGKTLGPIRAVAVLEVFSEDRQALSGSLEALFGDRIITAARLMAGRTCGDPVLGHNTFRIGGSVYEGYFTERPSHLFPVRGFPSNLIEAEKAAAAGLEVLFPLANLQYGYQSLPLFLHRLRLGPFVDAGFAGDRFRSDELVVGAGIGLVTSLEIAWGNFSAFRIGVAWPLKQPDFLDEDGPVFVFQLGRPL
jgi:hypothetical protein